ncbi:hypothetical protein GQ457_06G009230 [Hibiscus cannabinus]
MGSLSERPHFVLFPFMAQGHLLPMVDIGRLLAQRGVIVTIVTTPHNAGRVQKSIGQSIKSGHPIRLVQLRFPGKEVGFPEGVENLDMVHSMEDFRRFIIAANKMEEAVEKLFEKLTPRPNCIVSDICLYYTHKIATRFKVPRMHFNGFCCFCILCLYNIHSSNILETITSDSEYFTVPGLTQKVEFTKAQLPVQGDESWKEIIEGIIEAGQASYGIVINTFEELESAFVKEYKKVKKAWCIGPVSLSHKDESDKAERGNKASINEQQCLNNAKLTLSVVVWNNVRNNVNWTIGYGRDLDFWCDSWIGDMGSLISHVSARVSRVLGMVSAADMVETDGGWLWAQFETVLPPSVCLCIAAIRGTQGQAVGGEDDVWKVIHGYRGNAKLTLSVVVWNDVRNNVNWTIGYGRDLDFWCDSWIGDMGSLISHVSARVSRVLGMVSTADMVETDGGWLWAQFETVLPPSVCLCIAAIRGTQVNLQDATVG